MNYLLDTHAWIWLLDAPERMSKPVREVLLGKAPGPLGISIISTWEVARKCSLGKLKLSMASRVWLRHASQLDGLQVLPMSAEIAWESCNLPGVFHRDPADQIIAATARIHGLTLISCAQRMLDYPQVQTLW